MFRDREDAGRQLAQRLKGRTLHDPLVLGIPRGGVVVGAAIAREMGADLDVVLSRKLRAPGQPEAAIGAVAEDGRVFFNHNAHRIVEQQGDYVAQERVFQLEEIERRRRLFRQVRPAAPVAGRSIIVTDDGLATGSTMIAALEAIKGQDPHEVIVAVPVAAPDRLERVCWLCDEAICVLCPEDFWAIGQFYRDFTQVDDEKVIELLREFAPVAQSKDS